MRFLPANNGTSNSTFPTGNNSTFSNGTLTNGTNSTNSTTGRRLLQSRLHEAGRLQRVFHDGHWYQLRIYRRLQQAQPRSVEAQAAALINGLASFAPRADVGTCVYTLNILSRLADSFNASLNLSQRYTLCSVAQACGRLGVSTGTTVVSQAMLATMLRPCPRYATAASGNLTGNATANISSPAFPTFSPNRTVTQQSLWVAGNLSVVTANTVSMLLKRATPGLVSTAGDARLAVAVAADILNQNSYISLPMSVTGISFSLSHTISFSGMFYDSLSGFRQWCASDRACRAQPAIHLSAVHYADPAPWVASTSNFPFTKLAAPASSFKVISGIIDVQMGSFKTDLPVCNASTPCSMSIGFIIDGSLWTPFKLTACVRLQATQGKNGPLTAVVVDTQFGGSGWLWVRTCTSNQLGKHMIVEFDGDDASFPPLRGARLPPLPPSPPNFPLQPPLAPGFPTQPPAPLAPRAPPPSPRAPAVVPIPPLSETVWDGLTPPTAFCMATNDTCCNNYSTRTCRMAGCTAHGFCVPATNRKSARHNICTACLWFAMVLVQSRA